MEYRKEGRHAYYKITHPEKLRDLLSERKRDVKTLEDELGKTIKNITGMYNLSQHKSGIRFLEGPEGIREATFDSLKAEGAIYTIIDMDATLAYAKDMNEEYVNERIQRNIRKKQITLDSPAARERYKTQPADRLLEVRFLPAQKNPFNTGVQMYNNTVSYSTMTEKAQIAVIIEEENIARTHRALFEYVWESLPPLPDNTPAGISSAVIPSPNRPADAASDNTSARSLDSSPMSP